MLSLLCAYLCVPRRFRFILRGLAACAFVVVLVMVLMLFWRVLTTLPEHRGWILHPRPHQPMSPDFIRYDLSRQYRPVKEGM
jgi:hypothetical protein